MIVRQENFHTSQTEARVGKKKRPAEKPPRNVDEVARAVYLFPTWLIRAVKFDAARRDQSASRFVRAIVADNISEEGRRYAMKPEPTVTAS